MHHKLLRTVANCCIISPIGTQLHCCGGDLDIDVIAIHAGTCMQLQQDVDRVHAGLHHG